MKFHMWNVEGMIVSVRAGRWLSGSVRDNDVQSFQVGTGRHQ